MQMLQAGGMAPVTDGLRQADTDNPRGYFEHEGVKQLKTNAAFLDQAPGKSVKVIHALLADLPACHRYDILFLHRELQEVIRSQRVMLQRRGKSGAASDQTLLDIFARQVDQVLQWVKQQPNMRLLSLNHRQIVTQPLESSQAIAAFLKREMDIQAMAAAVDPNLYRHRST